MAGAEFKVDVDMTFAQAMFERLREAAINLKPLMTEIGSELEHSTRQRMVAGGPAPDGTPWVKLAPLTRAMKRGPGPLRERGDLLASVHFEASSNEVSIIAGPTQYAAVHQFGSAPYVILPKKGKALSFGPPSSEGKGKKGGSITRRKVNHPGAPARPFLGLSTDDHVTIIDAARDYLARTTGDR
ncbi:MAG: phage virion morphogenesis protein [Dehalococcoidia bacterium]|nr:phage virion morphogenesis protein [Dehalococcoidia bacterium]